MVSSGELFGNMFDILTRRYIQDLEFDKTIVGVIEKLDDENEGRYRVQYQGGSITAYSEDVEQIYEEGTNVYVWIPLGDMSGKKWIRGTLDKNSLSAKKKNYLNQVVVSQSPDLNNYYSWGSGEFGLTAGLYNSSKYNKGIPDNFALIVENDKPIGQYRSIFKSDQKQSADTSFQIYANRHEAIQITAEFQTKLQQEHEDGNYGLEIIFITQKDNEKEQREIVYFDSSEFIGTPYDFSVWSPQSKILTYEPGTLKRIAEIRFREQSFAFEETDQIKQKTGTIGLDDSTYFNLLVRNIKIEFVELKDLSKFPYYLTISANPDYSFTKQIDTEETITLTGNLIYKSTDISNDKEVTYKWYKKVCGGTEDAGVVGTGWVNVGGNSDIYSKRALEVNKSIAPFTTTFRLLASHEGNVSTADVVVFNTLTYNLSLLEAVDDSGRRKLQLVNANNSGAVTGQWYSDENSNILAKISDDYTTEIDITNFTRDVITFGCNAYTATDEKIFLGTLEITLTKQEEELDTTIPFFVTFEGQDVYNYKASGQLPIDTIESEHFLTAKVNQINSSETIPYDIIWSMLDDNGDRFVISNQVDEDGQAIYTSAPNNSMFEKFRVDIDNNLRYYVRKSYDNRAINNIIILELRTKDTKAQSYIFNKEILFIKDGDQGTNGTEYIAMVRPIDSQGRKTNDFLRPGEKYQLKCWVYKNGQEINNGEDGISISYTWRDELDKDLEESSNVLDFPLDITNAEKSLYIRSQAVASYTIIENNKEKTISHVDGENLNVDTDKKDWFNLVLLKEDKETNYQEYKLQFNNYVIKDDTDAAWVIPVIEEIPRYVKVAVTIQDNSDSRRSLTVHALYPIAVILGDRQEEIQNKIPVIPQFIQYSSSGYNPQYNDQEFDFAGTIDSLTPSILNVEHISNRTENDEEINTYKLDPVGSFIFDGEGAGLLKCHYNTGQYVLYSVVFYLDTYGNEAINGWDGTRLKIDDEGNYIFAPQIGAGQKEKDNTFTGVVMGKDSQQDKIGLYGYDYGVNTFGLMENGSAYFGAASSKGRIFLSGKSSIIAGGQDIEFERDGRIKTQKDGVDRGMIITLADQENKSNNYAIQVGKNVFTVDYTGRITAKEGLIGNWEINKGENYRLESTVKGLEDGSYSDVYINGAPNDDNPNVFYAGNRYIDSDKKEQVRSEFKVTRDGTLYANNADISGKIVSSSGEIGGWEITKGGLRTRLGVGDDSADVVGLNTDRQNEDYWVSTKTETITETYIENRFVDTFSSEEECQKFIDEHEEAIKEAIMKRYPTGENFSISLSPSGTGRIWVTVRYNDEGLIKGSSFSFTGTITETETTTKTVVIPTNSEYKVFMAGQKFYVTNKGTLYASGANISGTLTIGENDKLISPNVVIDNSGYKIISNKFSLENGSLVSKRADGSKVIIRDGEVQSLPSGLGDIKVSITGAGLKTTQLMKGHSKITIDDDEGIKITRYGYDRYYYKQYQVEEKSENEEASEDDIVEVEDKTWRIIDKDKPEYVFQNETLNPITKETDGKICYNVRITPEEYQTKFGSENVNIASRDVFYADNSGNLYLDGYITARGGTLGNWMINQGENYRLESNIKILLEKRYNILVETARTVFNWWKRDQFGKIDEDILSDILSHFKTILKETEDLDVLWANYNTIWENEYYDEFDDKKIDFDRNDDIGNEVLKYKAFLAIIPVVQGAAEDEKNEYIKLIETALEESNGYYLKEIINIINKNTSQTYDYSVYLNGFPKSITDYVFYSSYTNSIDNSMAANDDGKGLFYVTAGGKLYATSAEISGTIKSKDGEIGGWKIGDNSLSIKEETSNQVVLNADSSAYLGYATTLGEAQDYLNKNKDSIIVALKKECSDDILKDKPDYSNIQVAINSESVSCIEDNNSDRYRFKVSSLSYSAVDNRGYPKYGVWTYWVSNSYVPTINRYKTIIAGNKFCVTNDGILYADGANITGNITIASNQSLKAGNIVIDGTNETITNQIITITKDGFEWGDKSGDHGTINNDGILSYTGSSSVLKILGNELLSGTATLKNGELITQDSNGTRMSIKNGTIITHPESDSDIKVSITGTGLQTTQLARSGHSKITIDENEGIKITRYGSDKYYYKQYKLITTGASKENYDYERNGTYYLIDKSAYTLVANSTKRSSVEGINYFESITPDKYKELGGSESANIVSRDVFYANTAGNLTIDGYITARGGTLGNWMINKDENYRLESNIEIALKQVNQFNKIKSGDFYDDDKNNDETVTKYAREKIIDRINTKILTEKQLTEEQRKYWEDLVINLQEDTKETKYSKIVENFKTVWEEATSTSKRNIQIVLNGNPKLLKSGDTLSKTSLDDKVFYAKCEASNAEDQMVGLFYVSSNGHMYADAGEIGGWYIDSNSLYDNTGRDGIILSTNDSHDSYGDILDGLLIENDNSILVFDTIEEASKKIQEIQSIFSKYILKVCKYYYNNDKFCIGYYLNTLKEDPPKNWYIDPQKKADQYMRILRSSFKRIYSQNGNFYITSQGTVNFTQGQIGGWLITNDTLQFNQKYSANNTSMRITTQLDSIFPELSFRRGISRQLIITERHDDIDLSNLTEEQAKGIIGSNKGYTRMAIGGKYDYYTTWIQKDYRDGTIHTKLDYDYNTKGILTGYNENNKSFYNVNSIETAPFVLTSTGYLVARDAFIEGTINSLKGQIGPLTIDNDTLYAISYTGDNTYFSTQSEVRSYYDNHLVELMNNLDKQIKVNESSVIYNAWVADHKKTILDIQSTSIDETTKYYGIVRGVYDLLEAAPVDNSEVALQSTHDETISTYLTFTNSEKLSYQDFIRFKASNSKTSGQKLFTIGRIYNNDDYEQAAKNGSYSTNYNYLYFSIEDGLTAGVIRVKSSLFINDLKIQQTNTTEKNLYVDVGSSAGSVYKKIVLSSSATNEYLTQFSNPKILISDIYDKYYNEVYLWKDKPTKNSLLIGSDNSDLSWLKAPSEEQVLGYVQDTNGNWSIQWIDPPKTSGGSVVWG